MKLDFFLYLNKECCYLYETKDDENKMKLFNNKKNINY
jgi:hypothetical protein